MLHKLRSKLRPVTPAWFQGCAVFLLLVFLMGVWVHHAFQGHWWGPFLPGWQFGIPEKVRAEYGVFPTSPVGWDGQFYYYQANDLLATQDAVSHIDNPPYRYQRIGVPALARLVSSAMGQRLVSPIVYHLTQIACVALGYAVLVYCLRKNGHSSFWALAWLACDGVINALSFGLPDPVGDALFIVAAAGILQRNLLVYFLGALMLPFIREAYAVTCGLVVIATWTGFISWNSESTTENANEKQSISNLFPKLWIALKPKASWLRIAITLVPCVLVVAWQIFIAIRFGTTASQAGQVMVDYPLFGWWKGLLLVIERQQEFEIVLHFFALLLIAVTTLTLFTQRNNALTWICLPYIGLLSCMSWVAWEDYSGYLKACGTIIVMLLLHLPKKPGRLRNGILIFLIVEGTIMTYKRKDDQLFPPYEPPTVAADHFLGEIPHKGPLSEYKAKIEVLDEESLATGYRSSYDGFWRPFHRTAGTKVKVRVTNISNERWSPLPRSGPFAVNLSYQWINPRKNKVVLEQTRLPLPKEVKPGESQEFELPVLYPGSGTYMLRISMIQEGSVWFYDRCPQYESMLTIP